MFKMMIEIERPSHTSHAIGYAEGIAEGAGRPYDQAETWGFGLVWGELNRLEVSRSSLRDVYREWRETGRVAYTRRGRPRWIATEVRGGVTGVTSFARGEHIASGDVVVMPTADGTRDIPLVVQLANDGEREGGVLRFAGYVIPGSALTVVEISPDSIVEVSTMEEAHATVVHA